MTNSSSQETTDRRVRLFRNGRSQAVRIPKEMEFPGGEVMIRKEGERLIIEPAPTKSSLLRALAALKPTGEHLPDADEGLLAVDDVRL